MFLREDGDLEFIGDTYALGIPLMTNSKIMDAYLCSYQYLEPDEVTQIVQEQYNPFRGGPRRLRPTEEQNAKSLFNIEPLRQWLAELRQEEQQAA
jgi:hypothetical protein